MDGADFPETKRRGKDDSECHPHFLEEGWIPSSDGCALCIPGRLASSISIEIAIPRFNREGSPTLFARISRDFCLFCPAGYFRAGAFDAARRTRTHDEVIGRSGCTR